MFIPAFFVVTLQNAATLISKAFYLTGRVTTEHGLRRIRQNTRHFIEIMLPGALERHGEGWKLSVRIRLVHAQVRRLLRTSSKWDEAEFGVPLSAAHMALSSANFSATMLLQAERLGARLDAESRASFMQIWRYASWLVGSPEPFLFEGDEAKTAELHRIATICEPPPGDQSAVIANALVNAVPQVAGIADPVEQRKMTLHVFRVSRALLGNEVSDRLQFPRQQTAGLLAWLRWKRGIWKVAHRLAPRMAGYWRGNNFCLPAGCLHDSGSQLPVAGSSGSGEVQPVVGYSTVAPPIFVISTGRCGSTMVSDILNRHPRVLSLSEFISYIGVRSFSRRRPTGNWMWNRYSRQQHRTRLMLRGRYEELLYPLDDPLARFAQHNLPPILCATLPHLTERYEELFDEMAPFVRDQPRQPPADHFRHLFEWLCQRFGCTVWVERSGGSLLFASRLLHEFPEARVVHVFRDGRETAISMSRHYLFRLIAATMLALRSIGFDAMTSLARGKHWERLSFWLEPLIPNPLLNNSSNK